jgi:hypothetical protein
MGLRVVVFIFLWTCSTLCSCATYRPAPLKPAEAAKQFDERTLAAPQLCGYLRANLTAALPTCPPTRWDLASLTLAGFFYSPDLVVAGAQLNVARTAIYGRSAAQSNHRCRSYVRSECCIELCSMGDWCGRAQFPYRDRRQAWLQVLGLSTWLTPPL